MSNTLTNKYDEGIKLYKAKIKALEKKKAQAEQKALQEFSNFLFEKMKENEKFKSTIEKAFEELDNEAKEYLLSIYSLQDKNQPSIEENQKEKE